MTPIILLKSDVGQTRKEVFISHIIIIIIGILYFGRYFKTSPYYIQQVVYNINTIELFSHYFSFAYTIVPKKGVGSCFVVVQTLYASFESNHCSQTRIIRRKRFRADVFSWRAECSWSGLQLEMERGTLLFDDLVRAL